MTTRRLVVRNGTLRVIRDTLSTAEYLARHPDALLVTEPAPSRDELEDMMDTATATDGCSVEPDGTCPHGHPSWALVLGLI